MARMPQRAANAQIDPVTNAFAELFSMDALAPSFSR
jgi:hypothetical protein